MSSQVCNNTSQADVNGVRSLREICEAPADLLESFDVGLLNLLCASGLPGSENLDVGRALQWLDTAADRVDLEIRRHWYRFTQSPTQFKNSPGYYCCYYLLQVLQEDFGVKYNPERIRDPNFQDPRCFDPDFRDSRDLFIHGIMDGPGGCCASMPVLYVAVGRRLGFPLYLVEARGHLFFRWKDLLGKRFGVPERFNIEGAGYGIASHSDDYYKTWPESLTETDVTESWYLKSMSPREELAAFLATRGECLDDNGRIQEAIQAYQWACGLLPDDLRYRNQLLRLRHRQLLKAADIGTLLESNRENRERWRQLLPPGPGSPASASVPPHGISCQCAHCVDARRIAGAQPHSGHPADCICHLCRPAHLIAGEAANQPIQTPNTPGRISRKDFNHVLPQASTLLVAGPAS